MISQTLPYQWSEEKIPANNYTHLVFSNRRIGRKPGSGKVLSHLLSSPITHGSIGERVEDFNDGGGWWWSIFWTLTSGKRLSLRKEFSFRK